MNEETPEGDSIVIWVTTKGKLAVAILSDFLLMNSVCGMCEILLFKEEKN